MDSSMVESGMSRLNEALGDYMNYAQTKKEKLAELGSESKISKLSHKVQEVSEGIQGGADSLMALGHFGTAVLESKGVKGLKDLLSRYGGKSAQEPDVPEEPSPVSQEISNIREPETPPQRLPRSFTEPAPARTEATATEGEATEMAEYLPDTYSALDRVAMRQEHAQSIREADISSREKGLSRETMEDPFKYTAPEEPEEMRGYGTEAFEGSSKYAGLSEYDPARLRGSSTLARAGVVDRTPELPSIAELEQEQGSRIYSASAYRMERPPTTSRGLIPERQPQRAVVEQETSGADTLGAEATDRVDAVRGQAEARLDEIRGHRMGAERSQTALDEEEGGGVDTDEVSSLLDTIGGWSGALNILGGVGMLAGLGGEIYGAIESNREGEEEQSAIQHEKNILSAPVNVGFGSLALPTYDTTQMRGGGGMEHY